MEIFKSKRFWTTLVGLVFTALVSFIPALSEHVEVLAPAVVILIGLLVGGYTAEGVTLARQGITKYDAHKASE